ncbi:MAG TPA: acetylxylan esterase [Acidobacteriota bacterium]
MKARLEPIRFIAIALLALLALAANVQQPATNYDEAKVGSYRLPDPLVLQNGQAVRDAAAWQGRRRQEILELFKTQVYGRSPARAADMRFEVSEMDEHALAGAAIRKQVSVYFNSKKDTPRMDILIYLPAAARRPVPLFLALGFTGNHTIHTDPVIRLKDEWSRDTKTKVAAKESSRGSSSSSWPVEKILARGYGLAAIYYGDIEPDFVGGIDYGVRPLFYQPGQTAPAADQWGAIGAWAWGLSRVMDYLAADRNVDSSRVTVMGHSRLGKTALWAGAQDARFAMVISNDSGEGGAALSRRNFGETIRDLNTRFPHWFCDNYKKYSDAVDRLPVDQHMLLALVAPRPLYIASAQDDQWADPRGEFLSAVAASPVYRLLGKKGIDSDRMPSVNEPIMNTIGYHIRTGKHAVTAYDWDQFLTFADKHLAR